ncbi:MAG: hypothetical protein KGZ81_13865 [Flavobacteriales bacterium]|nr:hypothetical protein [Flavobacteriales bacterium]
MTKQFDNVSSRYGAPMGRWEWHEIVPVFHSVRLYRVKLNAGGYDDGGAYWGIGKPLFCFEQPDLEQRDCCGNLVHFRVFIRAESRLRALAQAGISPRMLKRPPMADWRKLRQLEFKGCISASGVQLRQKLQELGFED